MLRVGIAEGVILIIIASSRRRSNRRRRRGSPGNVHGSPTLRLTRWRWWHCPRSGWGRRRGLTAFSGAPWRLKRMVIDRRSLVHTRVGAMALQGVLVLVPRCNIRVVVTVIFCDFTLCCFPGLTRRRGRTRSAISRGSTGKTARKRRGSPTLRRRHWWARRHWRWWTTKSLLRSKGWRTGRTGVIGRGTSGIQMIRRWLCPSRRRGCRSVCNGIQREIPSVSRDLIIRFITRIGGSRRLWRRRDGPGCFQLFSSTELI